MPASPDAMMLFAAGLGTRMAPLTADRPKPLIEVDGTTLLDRALQLGCDGGAARIVVNTHYLGDQIACHLAGSDVMISDESDRLLDTGGGLRKALVQLGQGPVITLNPDAVWSGPNPITALRAAWDGVHMDALLMLVPPQSALGRLGGGDFSLDAAGTGAQGYDGPRQITRGGQYVYGGAQIIRPDRLAEIDESTFSINRLWDMMIAEGRAFGIIHPGRWCDVGRPECIPLAEDMLRDG